MKAFKRGGLWVVRIQCGGGNDYVKDTDLERCLSRAQALRKQKLVKRPDLRRGYYWLFVTTDKYELPIYVADTIEELAAWQGVKVKSIVQAVSRYEHGAKNGPYRRVLKEVE